MRGLSITERANRLERKPVAGAPPLTIAKLSTGKLVELKQYCVPQVLFDSAPDHWCLVALPIADLPWKQELWWVPSTQVVYTLTLRFGEPCGAPDRMAPPGWP